jgi:phage terminase large subunit-like protein
MAAHIGNCVAKPTPMGDLVSKDKKGSPRKIDAAVAQDRAAWHQQHRRKTAGEVVVLS